MRWEWLALRISQYDCTESTIVDIKLCIKMVLGAALPCTLIGAGDGVLQ